jgi:hypothetical protein
VAVGDALLAGDDGGAGSVAVEDVVELVAQGAVAPVAFLAIFLGELFRKRNYSV